MSATAAIVTIGNELVSGDVPNSNASWLAKRLEPLGIATRVLIAIPDELDVIAETIRRAAARHDVVLVTGGLGGTPDDITREALAHTFGVPQVEYPELVADLTARFRGDPAYVTPWAHLPEGSRPLVNPLGGAPGFALENVYVFPGLPAEMEGMFLAIEEEFRRGSPIAAWRRVLHARESAIAPALVEVGERWPGVLVGSYPTFSEDGPTVEVVLKSSDDAELAAAAQWLESALEQRG
jgi:molybdenum cofactor synthesis domain-containing protein